MAAPAAERPTGSGTDRDRETGRDTETDGGTDGETDSEREEPRRQKMERVLSQMLKRLGPVHPDVLAAQHRLGSLLAGSGGESSTAAALVHFRAAIDGYSECLSLSLSLSLSPSLCLSLSLF